MSEPQPNQTPNFRRFADWCLHKDSLSTEARHTVEVLLKKADTSDCYEAEQVLANCTELCLSFQDIYDLNPLSHLTQLTQLRLFSNQISDLNPLSRLTNLTHLELANNQIYNLSPLSGLTKLKSLRLDINLISDCTPLSRLINLEYLGLSSNNIYDFSSLSKLTNLSFLYLNENEIKNLSFLSGLTNLTELFLGYNQISDLQALSEVTNLKILNLNNNEISDLSPLSGLTELVTLYISNNSISDFSPILGFINLQRLHLDCNKLSDLSLFSKLTKLYQLEVTQSERLLERLNLLTLWQDKWRSLLTSPMDEQKTREAVKYAYTFIGRAEPNIIIFSSPNLGIEYLNKFPKLGKSLAWDIYYFLGERNSALRGFIYREVENQFLHDQHLNSIVEALLLANPQVMKAVEVMQESNITFEELLFGWSYITSNELLKIITSTELLVQELHYQLDLKEQDALRCLNQLFENCGWIFSYEQVCIVCDRPRKISLDNENRLHAEGEPAIQFSDGWHTGYYYHGVKLPEKYGKLHPQQWQAQWLLEEDNAELRRVLIQGIGYDRICEQLKAQVIDSWQEYTLLRIDADIDVEPIHLLKMTCPSTAKIHTLRVPPEINSARVAIRWVNWDIEPEDFAVQT
ncbi:MAG: leucine-rich repeat domain-containing protein [Aulosira sp. ZfuVER01]|nr:leucine-rich repeat domain-containing protein [Aulosira sp. ZfuVER01]MDZ8001409.1 leucine-rich repeat domain-containing protein [Aulosira sp. DedVER01a]MDZ8051065.1 leucine-rich repeat domain-containing protein [Aulosira sp. ZfuCHP01]